MSIIEPRLIQKTAVYTGSFDPITKGHLHIIEKARCMFDKLVVMVSENPIKKYHFGAEDRLVMCEQTCKDFDNVRVIKADDKLFTVKNVLNIGAKYLIRGIRSPNDYQEELDLYHYNRKISPAVETVFLFPDIELSSLRSSAIMNVVGPIGWRDLIKDLVPNNVYEKILYKHCLNLVKDIHCCNDILDFYKGKSYHNLDHIVDIFELWDEIYPMPRELRQAIITHDANIHRNELVRATFHEQITSIADLNNSISPDNYKNALFLHDADLSILSSSPTLYREYVNKVSKEYPAELWKAGRIKFLKDMLGRSEIYFSDRFKKNEIQARINMSEELKELDPELINFNPWSFEENHPMWCFHED